MIGLIIRWIAADIYENALDRNDGSREFFKKSREGFFGYDLHEITEKVGGGEAAVLEKIRNHWDALRERMKGDDGIGERMLIRPSSLFLMFRLVKNSKANNGCFDSKLFGFLGCRPRDVDREILA